MFTKSTAALLSLVVIWGVSWPIYKLAVSYTPPLLFAGLRAFLGGLLLAVIIFKMRNKLNWCKNWSKYCISAFFNTFLFFGLHTIGVIYLPGGLFSVLVYFQPVLLGLFAWIWLGENMTTIKMIGLIIGFLGIVVVSVDGLIVHISAIGVVLGILTALFWAIGVIYVKKVSGEVDSYWMVAMQLIGSVDNRTAILTFFESWSAIEWNAIFLFGLSWGATMGIPVAYVIYYKLVHLGDASKVGAFTFLVPVIAVYVSTVFLNEQITFSLLTGLLLVVISICLVNYSGKKGDVS